MPEHRSIGIRLPSGVIDNADERAAFFFVSNLSSVGSNAYDGWIAGSQNLQDRFTDADVRAINTTMTARTAYRHWIQLTRSDAPLRWLQELDPSWDLFAMDEETWAAADCEARILDALTAIMAPYRTTAIVTKLLHIKRPKLIPICDSYVRAILEKQARSPADVAMLISAVREVGRANLDSLLEISARLQSIGINRTPVRILDSLLWSEYQTGGPYAKFRHWLIQWHGGHLFFQATDPD